MSLKFVQRPSSRSDGPSGTLTYEAHFGLTEKAFSLTADARFVFDSPSHVSAAQGLLAGIRRREGLLVLTGEIGTGKTTLCRTVLRELGRTHSSLVPDPFASREDLLKMLLVDFGVLSIEELSSDPVRQASRTELGYRLSEFLDAQPADAFVIVIIDEAQNLSLPLIEETRLLSDTFGASGRLQIVLVGQPELHAKLKLPEMRQVDQRICGYHRLAPMSKDAVSGYIQHRLHVAGCRRSTPLFPPAVVDALYARSGGVPRLINRVCDRALQLAYERRAEAVDREILDTALLEIGAATLSPTWDSIVHSQPAAPRPAIKVVDVTPTIDNRKEFHDEIDEWADKDLPVPPPPAERRPSKPRVASPTRPYRNDWPEDVRSETYMERFWRTWAKRVAIVVAGMLFLNLVIAGIPIVAGLLRPAQSASAPVAPPAAAAAVPSPAASDVPVNPVSQVPVEATTLAPAAESAEFLVAVGLFSNRDLADALAETLTQAGLPVMQRAVQLRRHQVQQIVLGPYFTRDEATADLRRLQALGDYSDAAVVDGARERVSP